MRLIQNSVAKITKGLLTCADVGQEMLTKGLIE